MQLPMRPWLRIFTASLFLLTTGCASSLTASSPPRTTIVEGEKRVGDNAGLRFDVRQEPPAGQLILTQTPMCREMTSREKVSRKQLHGVLPAVIEIGFFGLGILDLVVANAIIENSETRLPLDDVPTGNQFPCAPTQPAAHRQVILQYSGADALQYGSSTGDGVIRTDAPLPAGNFAYVNVFVRAGTAKRFAGVVWLTPPTP